MMDYEPSQILHRSFHEVELGSYRKQAKISMFAVIMDSVCLIYSNYYERIMVSLTLGCNRHAPFVLVDNLVEENK